MITVSTTEAESLSDRVFRDLYHRIIQRQLLPGDILDRREIADELGVSVSPVVKALSRLEHEGIVEILPRKITRIRIVHREDFRVQVLMRAAMESQAARLFCGEPIRRNMDRLMEMAEFRDNAMRTESEIDWQGEIRFHRALVALADCPGFVREYDRIIRAGYFILLSASGGGELMVVEDELSHVNLLKVFEKGDPDESSAMMRRHVEYGKEDFLRISRPVDNGGK
ncbi:GntR family transcriptional regulator [Candidatus Sumerlaeota bacterium]|nr:GntR family transcriptional regulator [Candidatus Sumerlaeota bacterium]